MALIWAPAAIAKNDAVLVEFAMDCSLTAECRMLAQPVIWMAFAAQE
jgi:hypothetical protein